MPFFPVMRTVDNQGDGTLFGRNDFRYEPDSDTYICPGDKRLLRKHTNQKDRYTMYKASSVHCAACSLKSRCTQAPRRGLARHLYEDALNRMQKRVTPEAMRLRRCTVEHPFATIKYRIFGHPRLLMRNRCTSRNRHRDESASTNSSPVPITLLRYMRRPESDLSDQRRSHTSGPRFRFFIIKLQRCILILRNRSCGVGKMITEVDQQRHLPRVERDALSESGEHCFATAACGVRSSVAASREL